MSKTKQHSDLIGVVIIPLAYLILVLLLDIVTVRSTVTPLFGIIGLLVFSFSLHPAAMTFWATVYSLSVVAIFLNPFLFHLFNQAVVSGDSLTPILRSATFVSGAVLATLYCKERYRLNLTNQSLIDMLEKIPLPVVTADQAGRIHYANTAVSAICEIQNQKLKEHSFFDLFVDGNSKGASIADYLRRFSSSHIDVPLKLVCSGQSYMGATQIIDLTNPRQLMVIFSKGPVSGSIETLNLS